VDDDPGFLDVAEFILRMNGYRVVTASSAAEAVLRLGEIDSEIVAVVMTGGRDEVREQIERALPASTATCLHGPLDPQEAVYLVLIGDRDGDKSRDKKHTLGGR